ncbi:hypothetical protein H310_01820 [Aphanomyces invadans]|uniref:At1g61320/AtMIF1 LRR domain-containing protein n=1 Tax=Aphanomyces invadans TaxID=157072 RepID=A0A024ULC6_9STRA|nr:hypothetical protein H310_01820 [Aphanomyces invadans]ETW07256.1 hypothetical protein H310_01820 [Aphanomyces invadans]|eukprot:XP_008863349.1 hypothetical protein H310_01820 [Aphanomyces invadans]
METCPLDALWHIMAFLPSMDLASCYALNKSIHSAWTSFLGEMRIINMSYSLEKHRHAVTTLVRHASRARQVVLTGSHTLITDTYFNGTLAVYLNKMDHLVHVSVSYCTKLSELLLSSPTLESLHLSGCDQLTDLELQCPRLNSLTCAWCRSLNVPKFVTSSDVPNLTQLVLTGWDPTAASANVHVDHLLRTCPTVTFLNVSNVSFSNAGLHAIFASSSLRSVVFSQPQANVWVDGTWSLEELDACRRRRPDVQVLLL